MALDRKSHPSPSRRDVVIAGAGGHAHSVIDALESSAALRIAGLVDPSPTLRGTLVMGYAILGGDDLLPQLFSDGIRHAFVGVGSGRDTSARRKVFEHLASVGFVFPVIRHPAAVVAASARIGDGTVLLAGAIVNANAAIGRNAIINTGAIVEHDCVVEDHVHMATGSRLGGAVVVEDGCHIGIGATVIQGVRIGRNSLVAAGAVVVKDVAPGSKVAGVPARPMGRSS